MRTLLLGVVALCVACGGGGGGGSGERTIVLKPMAGLSGGVNSFGGAVTLDVAPVGDDGSLNGYRIIQCFNLDLIPRGVEILSAVYRNEQIQVVGGPYGALQYVVARPCHAGEALDGDDYDSAYPMFFGAFSQDARQEVKSLDLTTIVELRLGDGDTRLDLMLAFKDETDGDVSDDFAAFYGRAQDGDVPGIVVRYRE